MKEWLKLVRIHQWAKNLILFVPLVTSHRILEPGPLWATVAGFFAFSFMASATYILNDLVDLEHDRQHHSKRHRPLAAGSIGVATGKGAAILLGAAGLAVSCLLPRGFVVCLGIYVVLSLLYSIRIKKIPVADVTMLAGLYTLRLLAGHEAAQVKYSVWLLAFGIFFFLSLALAKRLVELRHTGTQDQIKGRGYQSTDLAMVGALGAASGLISVLVVILYVNSPDVRVLYERPALLLLLAPLLIYWIGRLWLLTCRGGLHEDPVLFALTDRVSYLTGAAVVSVLLLSTF